MLTRFLTLFFADILVNMLKKEKKRAAAALAGRPVTPRKSSHSSVTSPPQPSSRAHSIDSRVSHVDSSPPTRDVTSRDRVSSSSRMGRTAVNGDDTLKKQVCKY